MACVTYERVCPLEPSQERLPVFKFGKPLSCHWDQKYECMSAVALQTHSFSIITTTQRLPKSTLCRVLIHAIADIHLDTSCFRRNPYSTGLLDCKVCVAVAQTVLQYDFRFALYGTHNELPKVKPLDEMVSTSNR